jgi:hypothetical protein
MGTSPAIILLEGCDKVGKTTEAERLASVLPDCRVVHFGVPETNPFNEYRAALIEADQYSGSTVIDRLHWSNLAYQTVYRNDENDPRRMSFEEADELDRILAAIGGAVVLKVRPIDEIAQAMDDEDYGEANVEKIGALQRIFITRWEMGVGDGLAGFKTDIASPSSPGGLARFLVPFGETLSADYLVRIQAMREQALMERAPDWDEL